MRALVFVAASMISCGGALYDSAKCRQTCDGQPAPEYSLRVACGDDPDRIAAEVDAQCMSRFRSDCANPVCDQCVAYLSVTNDCPR